jgi:hypothetical protein
VAIKDSAESWVRGKPAQAAIIIAVVGLVLGGIIGLGAGYKIEQNRTKSDVSKLKGLAAKGGSGGSGLVIGPGKLGQSVGKVTAVGANTLTVSTKRKGSQQFRTTATTQFEQAATGKTADIVVGRRVLVTITGREVIVLQEGTKLGRLVTNVASDSFSIAKPNGGPGAKLTLSKVRSVSTLSTAKFSDIKTSAEVLAGGRDAGKNAFNAVEIILLPSGSGFAN